MAGADRTSPWGRAHAVVAGLGTSGYAAADALLELGASVTVLDDGDDESLHEHARILEALGARVRLGPGCNPPRLNSSHHRQSRMAAAS